MKIEGTYTFPAPQARVWEVFNTPQHLQEALPGCEKLEEREPGKFDVYLKIGIAAVKGSYKGKMEIADAEPPHRTRLIGEGKGLPGFVKGEALIQLTPQDQKTLISYQGDVQVGGLLAGVGQRMIGGVAKMLLEQFFKNMEKILKPAG
ncbi:MAG: carbon monoxide dehydrogenase subunit G [Proteobacteria bacterium]|nr:carbon monoxide dehydrogenase subunit G [Pseudomonadota bacterium]